MKKREREKSLNTVEKRKRLKKLNQWKKKFRYRQFLYVSKAVSFPPNNERKSQTKSTVCPFLSPPLPLFCHPFAQLLNFFTYSPNKYCTNSRQYPLKTLHSVLLCLMLHHIGPPHIFVIVMLACISKSLTFVIIWYQLIINDKEKVMG